MAPVALASERTAIERLREYELEEARILQRAMVPLEPLCEPRFEVAHRFRPVVEVGGDFLDYFLLSDHTAGLYLGDVVGKGLPAALYAALALGTLRGINKTGEAPDRVLGLLNKRLRMRLMPGRFCSLQYAVFDPQEGELRISSAGMAGPLHISASGCKEMHAEGLPSGLFDVADYEAIRLPLEPGDAVLFATDGLTDALNPEGEEFGMQRLVEICSERREKPASDLLETIFSEVDHFAGGHPQQDDMTAAVLKLPR